MGIMSGTFDEYNPTYDGNDPLEELIHFTTMIMDSPINFRKNSEYNERTFTKYVVCCCYDLRGFSAFCVEEPEKAKEIILQQFRRLENISENDLEDAKTFI